MFTAILDDGFRLTGDKIHWHEIPEKQKIRSLGVRIGTEEGFTVADDMYEGFEQYGFQKYEVKPLDGGQSIAGGVQLLLVSGDRFLTVDINFTTGQRRSVWRPLDEMTYNRSLLRAGA